MRYSSTTTKKKFNLEHAWKELRNDQKWCELYTCKAGGSGKRRKLDDGAHSSASHASETMNNEADEAATRPPGVKASMGLARNKAETEYQRMWNIKKEDMAMRDRILKMKLLDNLMAKTEPLAEDEEALQKKLITELLS
uniref:No apical meristem-associated C-terminal domain-containing protein n=1 Tax=Brassica oleracea var. oleracea TaxID=109376 RepID=A0A0D3CQA7_BRAOL